MSFTTATLTGKYLLYDNVTPAQGTIEIIPNSHTLIDPEGNVILSGRVKVKLGHAAEEGEPGADADGWVHDGQFSVTLPSTDDTTVEPATGRQYAVSAKLKHTGLKAVTGIELAANETVDMADVTPVAEAAAAFSVFLTAEEYAADMARVAALEGVSTAQATALAAKLDVVQREQSSGVAGLTAAGKLYEVRIPDRLSDASLSATYVSQASQDFTNAGLARLGLAKRQITWLTTFQAGHGYTIDGGGLGSSNANDATDPALGTQAVSVVSKGTTAAAMNIYKTGLAAIDFTGRDPVVWVKVSDPAKFAYTGLQLASDSGFVNQFQWTYGTDAPRPPMFTAGEWVMLTFPWAQAATIGAPTRSAITAVKLVTGDTTGGALTATFGGIGHMPQPTTKYPNGAIVICLDDCYPAHWSVAWPKMSAVGAKATVFPILSSIGVGSNTTLAQLKTMHDRGGWEIGAHGTAPAVHSSGIPALSPAARVTELNTLRNWLLGNAFEADSYAYPSGLFDAASCADVNLRFTSGRTIFSKYETYPVGARDRLRSMSLTNTATLASLQAIVDKVKADKSAVVFTAHDIKAAPSTSLEVLQSAFEGLIDYAIAQGVPIVTQRELMLA